MQIYTKGEGLVEFNSLDEMEHVIRKLDNTKFNGEYIRLIVRSWLLSPCAYGLDLALPFCVCRDRAGRLACQTR